MLGKAKFNITINMVNYKKGETYEIEKQITIDGLDYFEIIGEKSTNPKTSKNKEKETPVIVEKAVVKTNDTVEKETETKLEEEIKGENFDILDK